jgi:hypothetical protein
MTSRSSAGWTRRFWGQDFIDYFLLSRIDGKWQIVAKSFSHSGESA